MWTVAANELSVFRTPGGDRFTALVDDTVRSHASFCGVPIAEILTNVRTNKQDGGVDTEIRAAAPGDASNLMDVPTCWQYKATQSGNISDKVLQEEINKWYSAELISKGYGYRLCVCDDFPAQTVTAWETLLTAEARKINQHAPAARVLNASHLATWLSQYRGLVVKHFRPYLEPFNHIESWGQGATAITKTYVPVTEWQPVVAALEHHCDLSRSAHEPVLCIQAQPGTGKTRVVYEVLRARPALHGIVLYTNGAEHALALARSVLNDRSCRIVLVADECPVDTRVAINSLLMAVRDRCRIVCIDNSFDRPATGSAEYQLDKMPPTALAEILRVNFPAVPEERRRAYVEFSDGYVRFASDLCKNDAQIAAKGGLQPAFGNIRGYLTSRLRQDYDFVIALSLLTKLGCAGQVREQIGGLSRALGLDEAAMRRSLNAVKEQIGFVVRTPDYYYVTPELVAQICFEDAWARWVNPNIEHFLGQLDRELLDSFQKRVARSGAPEVRQALSGFFRRWAQQLSTEHLLDQEAMLRFEVLVNTDPDAYLPILADLIAAAPESQIPGVADQWEGNTIRRRLVWLAERLASFPEYFRPAETILLKLALYESELSLGNNATNIWRHLFRIALSGTAVPFSERQDLLKTRIFTEDERISSLALSALSEIFNYHAFKLVGPSTVAGRIVPSEWRPGTYEELRTYENQAFGLLSDVVQSEDRHLNSKAIDIVIQHVRRLLGLNYLEPLRSLITCASLSSAQLPRLLEGIDHFLEYDAPKADNDDYAGSVRQWVETLIPQDFHGRVVSLIGKQPWHYLVDEDKRRWNESVDQLAKEFAENTQLLSAELPWLCSAEARSAGALGQHLGRADTDARSLPHVLLTATETGYTALAQGYVQSLLEQHPKHATEINAWLDENTARLPVVARDIAFAASDHVDIVRRLASAISTGVWSIDSLRGLSYGRAAKELDVKQFRDVLSLVTGSQDPNAPAVGLELLAFRLWLERQEQLQSTLQDSVSIGLIWKIVDRLITDKESDSYTLFEVIKKLEVLDQIRVTLLASRALISDSYGHREQAEGLLADMAKRNPELVMDVVGDAALDAEHGWYFQVGNYKQLIAAIPASVAINWLKRVGEPGAKRLARHLPPPFLDQHGKPGLHPLTAYVLKEFESDDSTFSEFCAGVHNLQLYSGDIAGQHEKEAGMARLFLRHELRRVREWAQSEERSALKRAELTRKDEQERWLE